MSWFSGKVSHLMRDAQRGANSAAERAQTAAGGSRTADELAAELENQARRVAGPQAAAELLMRWVERSEVPQNIFPLAGMGSGDSSHGLAEPLNFHQVLLRSQALELLLEACGKQPVLRSDILRGGDPEKDSGSGLREALGKLAECTLLPGARVVWPGLLEVLLLSAAHEETTIVAPGRPGGSANNPGLAAGSSAFMAGAGAGTVIEPKCGSWAKRAVAVIKRSWHTEALPAALRVLDRKLAALAAQGGQPEEGAEASAAASLRSSGGAMSKVAIRAALAKERLKSRTVSAERYRQRTELLCDAVARLEAAESAGSNSIEQADKLLNDADDMLLTLDIGVKELIVNQEDLKKDEDQVTKALQQQIHSIKETASSRAVRRSELEAKRQQLLMSLEEVDMQLNQINEETSTWERQAKELEGKLQEQRQHYDEMIAGSFCRQKRLADEKLRAATCKECAHTALDVVRREEDRRLSELAVQLRRRRADLRRTCAAYLREERLCMEAAGECLQVSTQNQNPGSSPDAENDIILQASTTLQGAWRSAGVVLRRAHLLMESFQDQAHAEGAAGAAEATAIPAVPIEEVEKEGQDVPAAQDADAFFERESALGLECVDCGLTDVDWATVTYGAYLCMDCAGRHRGLGVHLSFVRSVSMDRWTPEQLARMRLGGTSKFQRFLDGYPELRITPRTPDLLTARYTSRAASYYRQLLDFRCQGDGDPADEPQPPPVSEGHLPDPSVSAKGAGAAGASMAPRADDAAADEADIKALDEEIEALLGVYKDCTGRAATFQDLVGTIAKPKPRPAVAYPASSAVPATAAIPNNSQLSTSTSSTARAGTSPALVPSPHPASDISRAQPQQHRSPFEESPTRTTSAGTSAGTGKAHPAGNSQSAQHRPPVQPASHQFDPMADDMPTSSAASRSTAFRDDPLSVAPPPTSSLQSRSNAFGDDPLSDEPPPKSQAAPSKPTAGPPAEAQPSSSLEDVFGGL